MLPSCMLSVILHTKLSSACCSHARQGVWLTLAGQKCLLVLLVKGLCSQGCKGRGNAPPVHGCGAREGTGRTAPVSTTGLPPPALLSLRIAGPSLPSLMHSTLHPRALESPLHPEPNITIPAPSGHLLQCPAATRATVPQGQQPNILSQACSPSRVLKLKDPGPQNGEVIPYHISNFSGQMSPKKES